MTLERTTFANLPFQRDVASRLARALARGRLAHAYLFEGPRGVGKEAVAYAFGTGALCREKPGEGCGVCNVCRRVLADLHPDFIRYEAEGAHFPIGHPKNFADDPGANVRKIILEAGRPPSESARKVLLVIEPEKMTYRGGESAQAANAFLKTLEEPPGNIIIILVSHDPRQLTPTILSRCVNVRFPLLSEEELVAWLGVQGWEPARARAAARLADGTTVGAAAATDAYVEGVSAALGLLEDIAAGGGARAAFAAAGAVGGREDALAVVAALGEAVREVAVAAAGAANGSRFPTLEKRARALARAGGLKPPEALWEELARAGSALHGNANVALTMAEFLLRAAA